MTAVMPGGGATMSIDVHTYCLFIVNYVSIIIQDGGRSCSMRC